MYYNTETVNMACETFVVWCRFFFIFLFFYFYSRPYSSFKSIDLSLMRRCVFEQIHTLPVLIPKRLTLDCDPKSRVLYVLEERNDRAEGGRKGR